MAVPTHVFGSVTISSGSYGIRNGGVRGFSAPPIKLDKQRKAQQDGEAIQRAFRGNARRTVTVKVSGADKDTVLANIQALEQETVGISQASPLVYQYTAANATNVNFLDVYSVNIEYDPNEISEIRDVYLNVTITMETSPHWRGQWTWVGTTNLLPYISATNEETPFSTDPATSWEESTTGVTAITTTNIDTPRSGIFHLLVNPDGAAANQGIALTNSYWIRVTPGVDYVFSAYGKRVAAGTSSMTTEILWATSAKATISSETDNSDITAASTRTEVTGTAPATAAFAQVKYYHNSTSADNFYLDDLMFEAGTVAGTYADPATTIEPVNNLVSDNIASVETDATGFTVVGSSTLSSTTSEQKFDTSALQIVTTANAGDGFRFDSLVYSNALSFGLEFTFSVYLKHGGASPGDDFDVDFKLAQLDSTGPTTGAFSVLLNQTVTDTWTRYELQETVSSSATDSFRITIDQVAASAETFFADGFMVEQSSSASTFTMPGPLIGQDSFSVSGDLPTEVGLWLEPVGDFTSEVYLGLHNQNTEGVATLVYDSTDNSSVQTSIGVTQTNPFRTSTRNTVAELKGTYIVQAQLTVTPADTDYKFRWALNHTSPTGAVYEGPWVFASSQVTPQWLTLGVMSIPTYPIPGHAESDFWDTEFIIRGIKDAGSTGKVNIWRVVLIPTDNGALFQSGVSNNTLFKTFSPSSVDGPSAGYQYFAGGFTLPPSWPTVTTTLTTEQSLNFSPFVAGPGTVDMVTLMKENSQSLLKVRWVAGYFPKFLSPVQ